GAPAPARGAGAAPRAPAGPARATAASTTRSHGDTPPAPCVQAKSSTHTAPPEHASQKVQAGRSPALSTAITAVAAGSRPVITALWAEVRCCSAKADRTGNPTTAPPP